DYCPDVDTGKPALGDYGQRRWTWPLLELTVDGFDEAADLIADRFAHADEHGTSPLRRCLARFEREVDGVRAAIAVNMPQDEILTQLVQGWLARAIAAVDQVEAARTRRRGVAELTRRVPSGPSLQSFFAANSRTFSFAARAFPRAFRDSVAGVYAFCRVTDDIADGPEAPPGGPPRAELLDLWRDLAHDAHAGTGSGLPLLDRVMRVAALAGVPFTYVDDLIEGMRMDLRGQRYASLEELHVYSYRVAGVVGQWLTRLAGVHDPVVLERAAELGHAMQLTNIVRDVGEDLKSGRIYLPADVMHDAGVDAADLHAFADGAPLTSGYRAVLETMMARADEHYAAALEATPSLPPWFRRAVVVAAHVYRGIHDQVRANGHDNFRLRAHTTVTGKVYLAVKALGGARLDAPVQSRPDRVPDAGPVRDQASPRTRRARTPTVALLLIIAATLPTGVRAQTAPDRAAARSVVPCDTAWPGAASPAADSAPCMEPRQQIDHIRSLFFRAVADESAIRDGHVAIAETRAALRDADDVDAVLLAYEGAFTALEAKHGSWALARFLTVRSALSLLDAAVEAAPGDLEIRYLRAVNGVHLPSLFGRGDAARRDLDFLTREIPAARAAYDAEVYSAMAELVLEHGSPTAADRALLHAAILRYTTQQAGESTRHE
ncbi:MAG TPA: phytoene/squalene synthase family protein, partial [Longimicrobiales bacterium]|nr:phytoene/squalene synthase family protein [Longimicrobiales bacterium]